MRKPEIAATIFDEGDIETMWNKLDLSKQFDFNPFDEVYSQNEGSPEVYPYCSHSVRKVDGYNEDLRTLYKKYINNLESLDEEDAELICGLAIYEWQHFNGYIEDNVDIIMVHRDY